ncbi:hypothetical protein [Actinoplanes sp. URMC 104]|uniref:hypothetical protein n=1 Tax=Actinoplanes sp. URMC 104 TaxID=3423409 RepID=UPI003F1B0BEA
MTTRIAQLLDEIERLNGLFQDYRFQPARQAPVGKRLISLYREVHEALHLTAHDTEPGSDNDDRLEQVSVTVHGVELIVRGRAGTHNNGEEPTGHPDLYVGVHTGLRDPADAAAYPLVVAVDGEPVHHSGTA